MKHVAIADFYNNIQSKFGSDYEKNRWFRSPMTKALFMMAHEAIEDTLAHVSFSSCLELGPGAGTWTKILREHQVDATYTLLDISETMLSMAKENLKEAPQIRFVVQDFLEYESSETYDLFFSSRAIEYILDKKKAVQKIHSLLNNEGQGILVTKNPRYFAYRLLGRTIPEMHRNQISAAEFCTLLREAGFSIESVRPATVTVPFLKSTKINEYAWKILKSSWIPFLHRIFAESYIVHFRKHGG